MSAKSGRVIDDDAGVRAIVTSMKRLAILGIKTEEQRDQPAFYVAEYLHRAGLEIVPVPVYYPETTSVLGLPVIRKLADIQGPVDVLDVFRRPSDIPAHLPDILTLKPRCVWFQLGIRHDDVAAELTRAGIDVVQDRCLLVDHRRFSS